MSGVARRLSRIFSNEPDKQKVNSEHAAPRRAAKKTELSP